MLSGIRRTRKIGQVPKVSHPVVSPYITDFKETELRYADIENHSDTDLLELLEREKKRLMKDIKRFQRCLNTLQKN